MLGIVEANVSKP